MSKKVTKKILRSKTGTVPASKKVAEVAIQNPLAVAVWLVDNTSLTFRQIAEFCGLHDMEVGAIANGTFAEHIMAISPIGKYLSKEEIERCQEEESAKLSRLVLVHRGSDYEELAIPKIKNKKYTPLLQRRSKPDAILWVLTFAPEVPNRQIAKLIGSTDDTVEAIRNKTHRSMASLTPKDPVIVGLCSQRDLDEAIRVARSKLPEHAPVEQAEMSE